MTVQSDVAQELAVSSEAAEEDVVVDVEGTIVLTNNETEVVFGVSSNDLVGEHHLMFFPGDTQRGLPADTQWDHQVRRRGYFTLPGRRRMDPGLSPGAQQPAPRWYQSPSWPRPAEHLYVIAHVSVRDE